jgi:hypothetical protein
MICYGDSAKRKSRRMCRLWSQGTGAAVIYDAPHPIPGEAAFFYGVTDRQVALFNEVRASGVDWYYMDNGYAPCPYIKPNGHPLEMFRITKNSRQHTGLGEGDPDRAQLYMPAIKPWIAAGEAILLCVQSDTYYRIWGTGLSKWVASTTREIRKTTSRQIILRDKPTRSGGAVVPFSTALETAHCVVTFDSRCAVEAILAGVPAFVTQQCAAMPMSAGALFDIECPRMPARRDEWAGVLASNQWSPQEIESGEAWDGVR